MRNKNKNIRESTETIIIIIIIRYARFYHREWGLKMRLKQQRFDLGDCCARYCWTAWFTTEVKYVYVTKFYTSITLVYQNIFPLFMWPIKAVVRKVMLCIN